MNTVFRFKEFEVLQHPDVFKICTDAVLLGALAPINNDVNRILEIGTGTGIISLMLAQRFPHAHITAIDHDPSSIELATTNFCKSPFSKRIKALQTPFQYLQSNKAFDLIVSNPPFFEAGTQGKFSHARHTELLPYEDLVFGASQHLNDSGSFSIIIPHDSRNRFAAIADDAGLYKTREVIIQNTPKAKPKRIVLDFSKVKSSASHLSLAIKDEDSTFSSAYKQLTKDFHPFL